MNITIGEKTIELKQTMRSLLIYENIKGEGFNPSTLENLLTFFYSCVIASSKDYSIQFDEFMDVLDENPSLFEDFTNWLVEINDNQETIKKKSNKKTTKTKKK